jgi:predicted metal-dependent phosphoesterase TrpH
VSAASPSLAIDLHTHSNRSDGSLTPFELLERARAAGVQVLALTDHDTVAGLDDARRAAAHTGIRLIAGVEISASWRAQGIHVLGLWIDPACRQLQERLESQAERRRVRMGKICARLSRLGLPGAELLRAVEAQPGLPTRAHLAQALCAGGHVGRFDEAFSKYLGKGKPAHLAADWPALSDVVAWIRAAGGVASLAHPARYDLSSGAKARLLGDFAAAGGRALEVVAGGNGSQHIESSARLAVRFGLEGSVGSDFHNPQQIWNPLGRLPKLPDGVTPVWRARGI